MNKKNELKDELKDIAPLLSDIEKKKVFSVPENYFTSLPDKVLDRVSLGINAADQRTIEKNWISRLMENIALFLRPKYAVGFTTAVLIIIAAVYFSQKSDNRNEDVHQLASQYVLENIDEFDVEMLWEARISHPDMKLENEHVTYPFNNEYFEELIDDLDDNELEKLL